MYSPSYGVYILLLVCFCKSLIKCTIMKTIYDSDVRYIPKVISLSITVRSTFNLNLVQNKY